MDCVTNTDIRYATACYAYVLFQRLKARYTLATTLNSTRSTLLKVDKVDRVALAPYTLATKSTVSATKLTALATKSTVSATKLTALATKWTVSATVDFVAGLLPVSATVDFQQSRPC